jgi:hypothetical protein
VIFPFVRCFVGFGEIDAESIEPALPSRPTFHDPSLDRLRRRSFDATSAHVPVFFGAHEAAGPGQLKMLGDRRQRTGETPDLQARADP